MGYSIYELTGESRERLLRERTLSFPKVITHHITYRFPDEEPPPLVTQFSVIGFSQGDAIECWVVSLDGEVKRPNGGIFHITASLDPEQGAKPVDSNQLLKEHGWETLTEPIPIYATGKLITFRKKKKKLPRENEQGSTIEKAEEGTP